MSMRKIREVLRLTHELGLSVREVREATGVGKTAVSEYVARAKVIGHHVADPAGDQRRRAGAAAVHAGRLPRGLDAACCPTGAKVHEELKRRGVTLMILWEEHRAECVGRPRLLALLRALRRMEEASVADRCGRRTWRAISCSSTGPATRCRSSIR